MVPSTMPTTGTIVSFLILLFLLTSGGIMGKTVLGIAENVEGALTYLLGWITGVIFLFIEKESKFVRFHAMQSTLVTGVITVLSFVFGAIPLVGILLNYLLGLVALIVWVFCMYKAFMGEKYKLPYFGEMAEKYLSS